MNDNIPEITVTTFESCIVIRYACEQWTSAMERDGFMRAEQLSTSNHRGLVIPYDSRTLTGVDEERWSLLRYDFRMHPSRFIDRLPLHIRKSSELPFVYITRRPEPAFLEDPIDEELIQAIAKSGNFDWILVHHRKGGANVHEHAMDKSLHHGTVSLVM